MKNKHIASALLTSMLAFAAPDAPKPKEMVIGYHRTKRVKVVKTVKPGRNHPAKGFDPVTNTWVKK